MKPKIHPEYKEITVTCSAGIAELGPDGNNPKDLIARADLRLLAAKRAGRNRTHANEVNRAA